VKVAFVVNDLQLSGGVGVVVQHAQRLAERHDMEVELVLARVQQEPDWAFPGLEAVPVHGMAAAREIDYDVVVATWWETLAAALELRARRHAYFVQSLEDRFFRPHDPQRVAAAVTHDLPVHVITEARWIAETLDELTPGRRCLLVRNGIAKDVFVSPPAPPVRVDGPLRVLIEGDPSVWFKGVREALEATRAMRERCAVTLVAPRGKAPRGAGKVIGPLTQPELATAYAEADVLVKLSRVEGMFGPPLEAFHMGTTCVVTAVTGHEEYVQHGENGLVVDWDDPRGTARALDLLARDRTLLHRLRWGALATARAWPSWDQQSEVMAAALREVLRRDLPAISPFAVRLLGDVRAAVITHTHVVAERDKRRWQMRPLDAVLERLDSPGVRRVTRPMRRAVGAARRRRS
jgi:glycosyltransferase involved in cell wall biosynthesis